MPTKDGISDADWKCVTDRALDLLEHLDGPEEGAYRRRLLDYLSQLEERYGRLPSILAARADLGGDTHAHDRESLLVESFALYETTSDHQGMLYTAHSLAEFYVDDLWHREKAAFWIGRLENLLINSDESWLREEPLRLRNELHSARVRRRGCVTG